MRRHVLTLAAITLTMALTPMAYAQATRTWVSGVGDDANPCSRTAPCKTFAGAISKTAAGGEINVLDPGGFGAVTITKSITIAGDGTRPACWSSGTNGIIVNAGRRPTKSSSAASTSKGRAPASTASGSSPAGRSTSRTPRSAASPGAASMSP